MKSSEQLYEQLQRLIDLPDNGVRSLSLHVGVDQIPTVVIERYIEDSADLELETKRFTLVDRDVRDALWEHGEITISGLVRLDKALGIDTYSRGNGAANQCDGCMRGLPVRGGMHIADHSEGRYGFFCTAERYTEASE